MRSYVEALERCSNAKRGRECIAALAFVEVLWVQWQCLDHGMPHENAGRNKARMIERANVSMICIWTFAGHLDQAVDQIRAFEKRYPPSDTHQPSPKHPLQSTRTTLKGPRPLVCATLTVELPDDPIPPLLTFADVEVLHRLVATGRKDDTIGYIKYICKACEGALRLRRDWTTMHSEPA